MTRRPSCHPDRRHAGRGLCKPCYDRHLWAGTLDRFPAVQPQRSRADFVADYTLLRAEGYTLGQIAARLGMKYRTAHAAYTRAAAAGAITRHRSSTASSTGRPQQTEPTR